MARFLALDWDHAQLHLVVADIKKNDVQVRRALTIKEKMRGPEHPSTASTLHALAALYHDQGKYEQAEPLYQRALAISEKILGPEHPDTARRRKDYTNLLHLLKQQK